MTDGDKEQDRRLARAVAEGGRLRSLLLELWQRTRLDWGFVTDRLSATFRRERWLGGSERRFVAETVYGMVRHLRRVDAAIAGGSRRGAVTRVRDEQRLLAYLVLEAGLDPAAAARVDASIDWRAAAGVDATIASERRPAARIALACSFPDWLAARLVADWGDEAEALARGLNARAPMTVRANTLKATRDALAQALAAAGLATTPGRWSATALHVETRVNLFGLQAFRDGWMEAQDEGSQLLAELVGAADARVVVDLCAGAGGKTLALAAAMANKGRVIATDVDGKKLEELRRRARRAGVTSAQAAMIEPGGDERSTATGGRGPGGSAGGAGGGGPRGIDWPAPLAGQVGKVDAVLVDAPCSGVGSLRRNPEARWRLAEAEIDALAAQQRALVLRGAELLAPGGRLVYGTCTVLAAENAAVVEAVLAARPDLESVPISDVLGDLAAALAPRDPRWMELTPHRHGTDGFFGAVLRRRG